MASSRLFTLLGPSFLRHSRNCAQIPSKFDKICCNPSTRFRCYSSSALSLDSDASSLATDDSSAVCVHPWPEWVKFVDRLQAKGYLTQNAAASENGGGADYQGVSVYTEMKLVKDACLSFGRDRFDIFKSLSTQDIQTIVEKGCPNLFRKAVNSSKRLRAYLKLDEGDVCSSCNLRGSCDRANVILSDVEAVARTVDVVRILLLYALDPLAFSGENKPPGRELVESSARKLLSELVELGDTPCDPNLPNPASSTVQRKKSSNFSDGEYSKNVNMMPGDWLCIKCSFMNFARNAQCLKCRAERPMDVSGGGPQRKKGDWDCPLCSFLNFAKNRQCFRCQGPRPQRELKPGDWECPECDFLNFSRNTVCRECNRDRPIPSSTLSDNDEQVWKKPY